MESACIQGHGFGKLRASDSEGFAQISSMLALSDDYYTTEQALEVVRCEPICTTDGAGSESLALLCDLEAGDLEAGWAQPPPVHAPNASMVVYTHAVVCLQEEEIYIQWIGGEVRFFKRLKTTSDADGFRTWTNCKS